MLVIGLIGGVASGKSFVATCFRKLGAEILDADHIGHEVLETPEVIKSIRLEWPQAVDFAGRVDRRILAQVVFRSPTNQSNLKKLERLTHPLISQRIDDRLKELKARGCPAVVLDAPVLLEADWFSKCHKVVFVESALALRQNRALARGWKIDELEKREKSQLSLERKRAVATDIIQNDKSREDTQYQVLKLWLSWELPPSSTCMK